ncbi:MAG TPA: TIGR03067 domain-containing protein [Pyrinomonadaceae bacterium]|nr:TIGR03067 domain-containing protein [Pyrinomonadaceae bacterium]
MAKLLTVFLTFLFAASYQQNKPVVPNDVPTISYCELISNAGLYAGRIVRVNAIWEYGFERSFLSSRECPGLEYRAWAEFVDDLCAGSEKKLSKLQDKDVTTKVGVVITGKLTGSPPGQRYGDGGYGYQFTISCVERAKQYLSDRKAKGIEVKASDDSDKIQGTWEVVSAADNGRKTPANLTKDLELIITTDKMSYRLGKKTTEWSYKLDPSKQPKWIDLTDVRETTLGIYELEGDTLKICFPEARKGERSTAFESKPNSVNDVLIILKREKD